MKTRRCASWCWPATDAGFCAGVDIKELARDGSPIAEVNRGNYDTFAAVYDCPVPVIVAVHGFVLGGGIGIVGASDIIIAAEYARPSACPKLIAARWVAARICSACSPCRRCATCPYTGELITAAEAVPSRRRGIGGEARRLLPAARALARIRGEEPPCHPPRQVVAERHRVDGHQESYRYEQGFTFELYTSPDSQEARSAFVEKRDGLKDKAKD